MDPKPQLPPLSEREIYALSHPSDPDFESEAWVKSWCAHMQSYKRPRVSPVLSDPLCKLIDSEESK